ncbi:MAG: ribose-phosphate diphosphokinase [Candidatus Bathyarchaeota archaeon]|jgi:ribose-phosphate pyrophosphokinase
MKIILGPASEQLGRSIAENLGVKSVPVVFKRHPDGESYIRLEGNVQDDDVVIVQTTSPPQDARIIQLSLMADAAKRCGAKKITTVVPYLAYARQDKIFLEGESVSIEVIARILDVAGVDVLKTVNVHEEKVLKRFPFKAETISAIPLLAEHFVNNGYEEAWAIAPDKGALRLAEEAKTVLGGDYDYLKKIRDPQTGQITMKRKQLDVKGEIVIVFDDIISTGGTIVKAAEILRKLGADEIFAACVHPLLIGDAESRILEAGVKKIIGTNSISSHVSEVSLTPLISQRLRQ